jgi:hypothetical protein
MPRSVKVNSDADCILCIPYREAGGALGNMSLQVLLLPARINTRIINTDSLPTFLTLSKVFVRWLHPLTNPCWMLYRLSPSSP